MTHEPSDRDREMVDSYLGAFLDYEKRMWPNSAVCTNARNAALMLVAAARAEGARDALAWRPIETAPRDGTRILLTFPGADSNSGMAVGSWSAHGWWIVGIFSYATTDHQPTSWLPLPPPPEKPE